MKYLIFLSVIVIFTILYFTRCDKVCISTREITKNLKEAHEQQLIYSWHIKKAAQLYNEYQAELKQASKAKVSQWKHEKQASNIYWSGLSFGNYAYAWWDEWLTGLVETWSLITWFTRRVKSDWKSKNKSELCYSDCTFTWVLQRYWLPTQPFVDNETKYWVKKELAVCIAWADSHLGRALKSTNNIWNVGNNDRWQVVHYETIGAWIEAMYRVLTNKYLWHKRSIWSLSVWGGGSKPYYATSPENWNNNVLNCLNTILDPSITEERVFRVE